VLSTLAEVLRDIFIVLGVMTALLVVLIVIIAKIRADNPLKRLAALTSISSDSGRSISGCCCACFGLFI